MRTEKIDFNGEITMKKLVSTILALVTVLGLTLSWVSPTIAADVNPLTVTTQIATGNLNAWTLYSSSPVMNLGSYPVCWYDGTIYHSYYEYNNASVIGHATSTDGITWVEDTAHNPVLTTGPSGAWDDTSVDAFNAWQESGKWYALY